ncbi:MAG: DNA polymerase I [Treponema sp.]|nr:DNA polymerase I [Treponema sp.]
MSDKETVYIIDSYGLIYRCYYAFISRPLTDSKGRNVSALFGFFRNLYSILDHYKPKYIAAAMDSTTPTFRHERYPLYKANRPKTPEDLHAQIPWIIEVLKAMNIPVLQCDGYEADDIIATVAAKCEKEGRQCRILSGDKDLMQLVTPTTKMLKPDHADVWKLIGEDGVKAEWGVEPKKMLDLLSLYGDTADNIPGVKGCGVKTACKFIEQYGDLEGIYEHADEIKGAIGQKIRDGKDSAFQSRELVRLVYDVPCSEITDFTELELNYSAAAKLLYEYEIPSCAKYYDKLSGNSNSPAKTASVSASDTPTPKTAVPEEENLTESQRAQQDAQKLKDKFIPLHKCKYEVNAAQSIQDLEKFISGIIESKAQCSISVLTEDPEKYDSQLLGIALYGSNKNSIYAAFGSGDCLFDTGLDLTQTVKCIEKLFKCKDVKIIFHDGKFTYKTLRNNGLCALSDQGCEFEDSMIAAYLIDNDSKVSNPYSLDLLAQNYIAVLKTPAEDIITKKEQTFKDLDTQQAADFSIESACIALELFTELESRLKKFGLYKLYKETEIPVLFILAEMELAGIHLDTKALGDYDSELGTLIESTEKEIYELVGHEFNIASTKQLQEVLFSELGLKAGKKTKTGYSTDTSVLEELALYHAVPKKILEFREYSKLKSTYTQALEKLCDKDSLIHTTFVQTGTATGRLSCKDPNLQNIPVRNEAGRRIRSAFTAKPGTVLISADYSQIELVVMAHLSGDKQMCDAFNKGIDVHKATASLVYSVGIDDVTADMRRLAKTINFGVIYGMSAFRLSAQLGISRTQAQEFINSYFANYSGVQSFINKTIDEVREKKSIRTLLGRSRYIPEIASSNKIEQAAAERVAVNTPIQGTAADIVKLAMIKVNDALTKNPTGAKLLLQVHDELIFECPDNKDSIEKTIAIVKDSMENAVKLNVPLRVSVEYGKNWGEFH